MPERTEAEWQAMDDRLAREVRGWEKVYIGQTDFIEQWVWHEPGKDYWECYATPSYPAHTDYWHPHRDPMQMYQCLAPFEERGWEITHESYFDGGSRAYSFQLVNHYRDEKGLATDWPILVTEKGAIKCTVGVLAMIQALDAEGKEKDA